VAALELGMSTTIGADVLLVFGMVALLLVKVFLPVTQTGVTSDVTL